MPDDRAPVPPPADRDASAVDDGQQLARGAAANALVLLAANFRGVFVFLIARLLGEAALGRFGMAFATTELLSKVGMLGFDNSIIPFLTRPVRAGDRDGAGRVLREALWIAGLVSTAVALVMLPVLLWLAARHGYDAFAGGGTLMLLALPGIAAARISTGASRAVLSMRNEFYSRGVTETWVTIGVFLVAMALGFGSAAPAVAVVAGSCAAAGVAVVLAFRALDRRIVGRAAGGPGAAGAAAGDGRHGSTRERLRFSLPIAASSLLSVLVMRVDLLLLGLYVNRAPGVTVEAFGIFTVCAEIAGSMRKVRQVFDPIFAPVVAGRALGADRARLRDTVAAPGRWVLAAQLPLVGLFAVAGGLILSVYGAGFERGATWLALLAVAHGTNTFAGLVETLFMVERPGLNLVNAAVTIVVQVVAGFLLIPRLGVSGAALAMCIGFAVQGALRFAEVRHVFGWSWPWASLSRPLLAFALACAPALVIRWVLPGAWGDAGAGIVLLAGYVWAWMALGADPADREVWARLVRRR